jgi:hypothetical protein
MAIKNTGKMNRNIKYKSKETKNPFIKKEFFDHFIESPLWGFPKNLMM